MSEHLSCDLLVLGGGMAGLCAGAWAAERGARVIVIEKTSQVGGSAAISGAVVWTLQSRRKMQYVTEGRSDLHELVIGGYPEAIAWLRGRGVAVSPAMNVLNGQGYQIDIIGHIRDCVATIEANDGHIALSSTAKHLTVDTHGAVTGALVTHEDGDLEIHCPWTLLATGGYQADSVLRARYIHPHAREMRLRSNIASDGAGLRLGLEAGGVFTSPNPGFYGHLVTASPSWGDERLFNLLTQHHSAYSLLLNERGERFCDESAWDHVNTQEVLAQEGARALLVWDEAVQQDRVLQPLLKVSAQLDRMKLALEKGAQGGIFNTLEELAQFADEIGFDGARARASVEAYNRDIGEGWERLSPPRVEHHNPVATPPFYALVVYPAITYTFGGLRIDASAQVVRPDDRPVRGLLAAGADAGDVFRKGYGGGLTQAITLGLRAAKTAGFH